MVQRIALCGAPMTGKTTLLSSLARIIKSSQLRHSFGKTENLARLDFQESDNKVAIIAISGSFHYSSSDIITKILSDVYGVIYVCSALPAEHILSPYDGYIDDEIKRQRLFWDLYVQRAEKTRSLWSTTPWIFVLNKVDLGKHNPLSQYIPAQFHKDIISCVATQDIGIAQLSRSIMAILR